MSLNDIQIKDGDFVLDVANQVQWLEGVDVIAQDVKHRIMESGLVMRLIGLRSPNGRASIYEQIKQLVEEDERLQPGTTHIVENGSEFYLSAKTTKAASLKVQL